MDGNGRIMAAEEIESVKNSSERKGRKFIPALCRIFGTVILLGVIAAFFPLTAPRLMGYEIYEVISGSMEPEIPVGSVIYVRPVEPEDVENGDIIAFVQNGSMITHRVEENRYVEGEFITKGDANSKEDMLPVEYDSLEGKVMFHFPVLGRIMTLMASNVGKLYAAMLLMCGVMFHMLARIL